MATKAPPYPKQKYTDAKFREILPLLPLFESMKIEYLSKGVWYKMISKRGNSYNCECCGMENLGPTPIVDHVRGKKHRSSLQNTEKLFHPNYTTPRNSNIAARTPILDALNGVTGANTPGKLGTKPIPTKVSTGVQKTTGPQKAAAVQAKKAPVKKATPAVANSVTDAATKVDKADTTQQAAPKPLENSSASGQSTVSNQSKTPLEDQGKEPSKFPAVESAKESTTDDVKQEKEAKETANGQKNEIQKQPVVEEEDDVIIVSDNLDEIKNSPQKVEAMDKAITVITSEPPKPQRPPKNTAKQTATTPVQQKNVTEPKQVAKNIPTITETKKPEPTPVAAKKVLNPAAIIAKTAEKSDENVPRYEQNRVIIPTIDKTKKKQHPEITAPKKSVTPAFSTKTFSTNVNEEIDGIIGVEYVVKILKVYNDPEPFYECCLCEVVMDGIGMQTHLLGYNHRYKYVEKHFPTCFNQCKEHIGNIQVMGIILDRVAKAIEAHHGRELPYECLSGEFRSNRHGVMTTVYSFRHASEYSGPSFTNVVDAKQVEEFYKKKNVYQPPKPDPKRKPTFDTRNAGSSPKRSRVEPINMRGGKRGGVRGNLGPPRRPYREEIATATVDDEVHKQMVEEFLQNTRERSRSPVGHRRRHKSRSRSRSPHRMLLKRSARRSPSPLREGDVWQAYRHLVDRSKVELDEMYKEYRKDPEKHPMYNEEWRKFWKQRKDEIAREGLDYRNYDFQPEWVRFFAVRIEELYDEALENIKINSRQRLILPMTNEELDDKRYHITVPELEEAGAPPSPEVHRKMSVVHVLRLLTALEDYLGSLGPRVVDLLSKALLVEKSNPKDVNEIVLTLDNCTILETAMEKLKGVLIAGLLEGPKVRAFNNVIMETEKILKYAFKIRELNPQPAPQPVPAPKASFDNQQQKQSFSGGSYASSHQSNSMGNGNSGAAANLLSQIDKKELATKLAAALTAQGKTDFNPEQLQQLIAVYSLIDKKKRDSAAADKQKMTLSDTLTALLNPKENSGGGVMSEPLNQLSGRNYSNNSSDRQGTLSNSSINNFVSMLNRDNASAGGTAKAGETQMWQNLQNIQNSLRIQNAGGGSSTSMGEGRAGRSSYMNDMTSGSAFSRSGFGTGMGRSEFGLGQNSSLNRGGIGGGSGTGGSNKESGGFYGNFQGMSSSSNTNFSRGGDESGRGFGGNNRNFTADNSYSRGGASSSFSRNSGDNFLGIGSSSNSGGSGFSSNFTSGGFSSSGGFGSSGYQRGSGGGGSGLGLSSGSSSGLGMSSGGGSGQGGASFGRGGGGGGSGSLGYGSSMSNSGGFSKNLGRNEMGGSSQQFNSNTRGMGGNQGSNSMGRHSFGAGSGGMSMGSSSSSQNPGGNRGGSNWRNQ